MDAWTIYASSGEYDAHGTDACAALTDFTRRHPGDPVAAIVNDLMEPRLVREEEADRTNRAARKRTR